MGDRPEQIRSILIAASMCGEARLRAVLCGGGGGACGRRVLVGGGAGDHDGLTGHICLRDVMTIYITQG